MASQQGPQDARLPTEPKQAEKSLGQLMAEMTSEVTGLMRNEVQLAKSEIKEEVGKAGKAGGIFGAGGITAYLTVLFASFALAWLLDDFLHVALAFFLVAVIHGIAASILINRGREEIKKVDPVPRQTVETLKEDVEWAKAQKS